MLRLTKFQIIFITATISNVIFYGFLYAVGALRNGDQLDTRSFNKVLTIYNSFQISRKIEATHPFKILFWTKWYGDVVTNEGWAAHTECGNDFVVTSNKSELNEADIIVFQYVNLIRRRRSKGTKNISWPHPRNKNVPWVLALQESPINTRQLPWKSYNNVFNWTWSHRPISEIHHPAFSEMYPRHEKPDDKWIYGSNFSSEFLRNKSKQVVWVVSNCKVQRSKRNELAKQLKLHGVQVDIFGRCGNATSSCRRGEDCFKQLGKTYKFYFAAENSLCVDYATEKIHHGLRHGMVPIVYGLGNYEAIAPPSSYIHVMDFESIVALANYIKSLDKSPEKYFRYFEWRKEHNVNLRFSFFATNQCLIYRQMKMQVTDLKGKGETGYSSRHVYKRLDLKLWFDTFYNQELKLRCNSCLRQAHVKVAKPILNKQVLCREHTRKLIK